MKTKNRVLAVLMALIMVLGCMPFTSAEELIPASEYLAQQQNQGSQDSEAPGNGIDDADGESEPEVEVESVQVGSNLNTVDLAYAGNSSAIGLHGTMATDPVDAYQALSSMPLQRALGSSSPNGALAQGVVNSLKVGSPLSTRNSGSVRGVARGLPDLSDVPRQLDGSQIEGIEIRWMTPDTVAEGVEGYELAKDDDTLLYIKPVADNKQSVRLRINYSLSGEHNYEPGDINITIPANIFKNRSGQYYGTINIPYPEDPSTKNDFNWKLVDDVYVLTNTKRMSAATRGYVEIGFYDLYPHELVDMQQSEPFVATIEVLTHKGNLIGLTSNPIYATFDTEARVTSASKRQSGRVKILSAAEVPAAAKKDPITGAADNEEYYVMVNWYAWAYRTGNTEYTITLQDVLPSQYNGRFGSLSNYNLLGVGTTTDWDRIDDPTKYGTKDYLIGTAEDGHARVGAATSTETYSDAPTGQSLVAGDLYAAGKSYVDTVNGTYSTSDARVLTIPRFYDGYVTDRDTSYQYIETYYPLSQFEEDHTYTFVNTMVYTLTEKDPAQGEDPKLQTIAVDSAVVNWTYQRPRWMNPIGHFMVYKNGNDNAANNFTTHKNTWTRSDILLHADGYYGMYHTALNDILDNTDPEISYTINSLGYIMPWTLNSSIPADASGDKTDGEKPARMKKSYFQRAVDFVTTDEGLSWSRNGRKLYEGDDYDYSAVQISAVEIWDGEPKNINADGSFEALYAGDGTFEYTYDSNYAHYPTIFVEEQHGETWTRVGEVSWDSVTGAQITKALPSGTVIANNKVPISESASCVRTVATTNRAGLTYDARIFVKLHNTQAMKSVIDASFVNNYAPELPMWNSTIMECSYSTEYEVDTSLVPANVTDPDLWSDYYVLRKVTESSDESAGQEIVSIEKDGYDLLRGYTTDLAIRPAKNGDYTISEDVNYEDRYVTIHFTAQVEEQSYVADRVTYETARERGSIPSERSGVWYDLLPKGFTPVLSTVKLRPDDLITNIRLTPNYKNTGRTLMKISAELVPVTATYKQNDVLYYEDKITLSFDARYNFDDMIAYGKEPHNVVAFESSNASIGSVEHYMGELGDLSTNNNVATNGAFDSRDEGAERDAMTNLHRSRTTPSFVYAGAYVNLDFESAARVSLSKDVMVNNDGLWGDGVYYDYNAATNSYNEVVREANKKIVYNGGVYQYRLRMQPADRTTSKDMILYDSLENFYAGGMDENGRYPNDQVDYNAPRWQGTLERVDISQIEAMGGAPVLYYSTVTNLQLADETDPEKGNAVNMDLSNSSVWVRASDYTGSLADVKAIAVDATKDANGNDFSLNGDNNEAAQIVIHMRAPNGQAAQTALAQKPTEEQKAAGFDWGESANAYNNAFLTATLIDNDNPNEPDQNSFVRKDYTKVGLAEYSVVVEKIWDDDNNRDGKRPEEPIVFTLYRNEEATGLTQTLQPGETEVKFANLDYCDSEGIAYSYTVTESDVPGYTRSIGSTDDTGHIVVRNVHPPERVRVSGDKTWENDNEEDRPESLIVLLYADDEFLTQKTIYPSGDGSWAYSFENLYRYKRVDNVTSAIQYRVEEKLVSKAGKSYIPSYSEPVLDENGNMVVNIINTRHPYGSLYVSKTVQNTTPVSAETLFDFTFVVKYSEEMGGEPVITPMAYQIVESADPTNVISEGTLVCDDVISIKGGQTIYIPEVPEYVTYIIYEGAKDGFTAVGRSQISGQIVPNSDSHADFINRYAAQGRFQMKASKRLNNRKLTAYQFRFELLNQNGDLVRTASNSRVASNSDVHYLDITGQDVADPDVMPVDYSVADVTFGALRFTQDDLVQVDPDTLEPVLDENDEPIPVGSREYVYYVHEVDTEKGGYTYDDTWYEVRATVTDAGDGTLDVTSSVKKMVFAEGVAPVVSEDGVGVDNWMPEYTTEDLTSAVPQFVNTYNAEGELTLRAWKDLKGRDLADYEFVFDLLSDKLGDDEQPIVLQTKKNVANGSIVFDPIEFDESDIGLTYYFILREKIPLQDREGEVVPSDAAYTDTDYTAYIDPTVIYTKDVFGYSVTVFDNGDGTLSFETGLLTPEVETENVGTDEEPIEEPTQNVVYKEGRAVFKVVIDEGDPDDPDDDVEVFAEGALPVFTNTLKPGSLSVSKYVQDDTGNADPNQEFTFRVVLIGEDVTDDLITEYELQPADPDKNPLNTQP